MPFFRDNGSGLADFTKGGSQWPSALHTIFGTDLEYENFLNALPPVVVSQADTNTVSTRVTLNNHGFTVGQAISLDLLTGQYVPANSNTQSTLGLWVVSRVLTANQFQMISEGAIVRSETSLAANKYWYVGENGELSENSGIYSNPIGVTDSNYLHIFSWRGSGPFDTSQANKIVALLTLEGANPPVVLSSLNVESVTRNAAGNYTVNFLLQKL